MTKGTAPPEAILQRDTPLNAPTHTASWMTQAPIYLPAARLLLVCRHGRTLNAATYGLSPVSAFPRRPLARPARRPAGTTSTCSGSGRAPARAAAWQRGSAAAEASTHVVLATGAAQATVLIRQHRERKCFVRARPLFSHWAGPREKWCRVKSTGHLTRFWRNLAAPTDAAG